MSLGGYDILLQRNLVDIESMFLNIYASIGLIVAFYQTMLSRYMHAVSEVERANVVLAERLAERAAELNASHEKLREIERREVLHRERRRLCRTCTTGSARRW